MIDEGSDYLNAIHPSLDHIRRPQEMFCTGIRNRTSKKKNAASCRCSRSFMDGIVGTFHDRVN
jgi:hypothetical protein